MHDPLTASEILLRLLAATLAGTLIGLERETRGRPAGLRTTILACVASAISMVISESLFVGSGNSTTWRPDPARLGAGILTGIGFLGAGTIMRNSNIIRGVTTAATLWFVTVLGLAFGTGLFMVGTAGTGIALLSLILLPSLERFLAADWYATLTVTGSADVLNEAELKARLAALHLRLRRVKMRYDLPTQGITLSVEVQYNRRHAIDIHARVLRELRTLEGLHQIRWT